MATLVLALLPILAAAVLVAALVATGYIWLRARDALPSLFARNLPRKFFGLPPARPERAGPRYRLLLLAPAAAVSLAAGWYVVVAARNDLGSASGVLDRRGPAVALALASVPVPAALVAAAMWVILGDRRAPRPPITPVHASAGAGVADTHISARHAVTTGALATLPPLVAALLAGRLGASAATLVIATLISVAATGLGVQAWRTGNRIRIGEPCASGSPASSPSAVNEKHHRQSTSSSSRRRVQSPLSLAQTRSQGGLSECPALATTKREAAAAPDLEHAPRLPTLSRDERPDSYLSYLSERSNAETIPEWSFSVGGCTTGTGGVSYYGQRESELYGLSEVAEAPEEEEESDVDEDMNENAGSRDAPHENNRDVYLHGPGIGHDREATDATGRSLVSGTLATTQDSYRRVRGTASAPPNGTGTTPHAQRINQHRRNPSTPYADEFSVLASYSPNPFAPLPRGFASLTTLRGSSHDTLALCDQNTVTARAARLLAAAAPAEKDTELLERERPRNASGTTTNTFATDSSGPIQLQLRSFEGSSTSSVQAPGSSMRTGSAERIVQPPFSPPKQAPKGPRGHNSVLVSRAPLATSPTKVGPAIAAPARSPRPAPLVLSLSPVSGTLDGGSPPASPVPPTPSSPMPASQSPMFVDDSPRHLWLPAIACAVITYVLNAPLLATYPTQGTLTAFTIALLVPSLLLAVALFYPHKSLPLSATPTASSASSAVKMESGGGEMSFEQIDLEAGYSLHSPHLRSPTEPEYTLQLPDELFPLNMPHYPNTDHQSRNYPFHAYSMQDISSDGDTSRPHTLCDGEKTARGNTWVDKGHARSGLDPLGRAGEMLKPRPTLCVMAEPELVEKTKDMSTKRHTQRQSIIGRLRWGIESMIERTDSSSRRNTKTPPVIPIITKTSPVPSPQSSKTRPKGSSLSGTPLGKKPIKGSGESLSGDSGIPDADTSHDTEMSVGSGLVAQIEVATIGRRSASSSVRLTKDNEVEHMAVEILTNMGIISTDSGGSSRPRDKKDEADESVGPPVVDAVRRTHHHSTSIELPFRPSVDAASQSTPRRRMRGGGHVRQSSSFSDLYGNDRMDFSRPSDAPAIDYATSLASVDSHGPAGEAELEQRRATSIDVDSLEMRIAESDCAESIFRSAALAREFLEDGEGDGQKESAAIRNSSPYRRALRAMNSNSSLGLRSVNSNSSLNAPPPTTPRRGLSRLRRGSTIPENNGALPPELSGRASTNAHGHMYHSSIGSLTTVDQAGVEVMEEVMAMDTPARARWVTTPTPSLYNTSTPSSATSRVRLSSDATDGSNATERKKLISTASSTRSAPVSGYDGSDSVADGTNNGSVPRPPLPPLPALPALPSSVSSIPLPPASVVQHPHPPPFYALRPATASNFFGSSESLAAVLEGSFEGYEHGGDYKDKHHPGEYLDDEDRANGEEPIPIPKLSIAGHVQTNAPTVPAPSASASAATTTARKERKYPSASEWSVHNDQMHSGITAISSDAVGLTSLSEDRDGASWNSCTHGSASLPLGNVSNTTGTSAKNSIPVLCGKAPGARWFEVTGRSSTSTAKSSTIPGQPVARRSKTSNGPVHKKYSSDAGSTNKENSAIASTRPMSAHAFPYSLPWDEDSGRADAEGQKNVRTGRGRAVRALTGIRM